MFPPNKFLEATLCGLCVFSPPIPPGRLSPRVSGYQAPTLPAPELLLLLCKMTAIWAGGLSVATTFQPPSHLPSLGSHSPDPSEQDQTGFGSCSPRSGAGTAEERAVAGIQTPIGDFLTGTETVIMMTPGHILQSHWPFACCPPQGYPERILSYPAKSHPSKALALSCQDEIFLRSSL